LKTVGKLKGWNMPDVDFNLLAANGLDVLELDQQLCFALNVATRQVIKAYRPVLTALNLTHPQYLTLLVLWEWARDQEPRPTVKALGERIGLDSGTTTPLLRRMETLGLITRTRSSADSREVFVHLTPKGVALKKRARRVPLSLLEQSPVPIGELLELRARLKRLSAALPPLNVSSSTPSTSSVAGRKAAARR
jgi:DNA-binding MarR family transcriptional regulator